MSVQVVKEPLGPHRVGVGPIHHLPRLAAHAAVDFAHVPPPADDSRLLFFLILAAVRDLQRSHDLRPGLLDALRHQQLLLFQLPAPLRPHLVNFLVELPQLFDADVVQRPHAQVLQLSGLHVPCGLRVFGQVLGDLPPFLPHLLGAELQVQPFQLFADFHLLVIDDLLVLRRGLDLVHHLKDFPA